MANFDLDSIKLGFIYAWNTIKSNNMLIYSISLGEINKIKPLDTAFFIDWALANMFYHAEANPEQVWDEEALPYLEQQPGWENYKNNLFKGFSKSSLEQQSEWENYKNNLFKGFSRPK